MGLTKSKGNMYDWVTHTHAHLRGKCTHECAYCYVQSMGKRFPEMAEKYSGPVTLDRKELEVAYGRNRLIFIEHMNDLFAEQVPTSTILEVLNHCLDYPDSNYVFQTKNPGRYQQFWHSIPFGSILGTTVESNRVHPTVMGNAPSPFERTVGIQAAAMRENDHPRGRYQTFITVEPILDFDVDEFAAMLIWANPTFVNIGADSKDNDLPEPPFGKVMELYDRLTRAGVEVKKKLNLDRLEVSDG